MALGLVIPNPPGRVKRRQPSKGAGRLGGSARTRGSRDTIAALRGGDLACGSDGRDTLGGNKGSDTLIGGLGNDVLNGGPGRATCKGGPGKDEKISC